MRQIFDWLREQIGTRKGDSETRMWRLIDEDRGDRCVYSETDVEEFAINTWAEALSILDEAEAKLEADCCEWKQYETKYGTRYQNCRATESPVDTFAFKFCPYCGKPIKIVEVE